ncbi:MAG: hypothetical protein ACC657_05500 [Thiohalomonadales bacterium]
MKNMKRLFLLLIVIVSGCAEIGKNSSKLQTPDHNKYISGIISDDKYYAMDNSYSISLPYKKGTPEYAIMDLDEFYHENGSNVTFGPFGKNKSIYNMELFKIKKENNSINSFEESSLKLLSKYHNNLYKSISDMKILNKKHIKISGKRTIHWNLLKQVSINGGNYGSVRHHIFSIKLKNYIAIIMVEKPAAIAEEDNYISAYNFAFSLSLLQKDKDRNLVSTLP